MRTLLLAATTLLHLFLRGQGLTYAEVFNYDLGDVVQVRYYYEGMQVSGWPSRYIRDSIIGIAYNVNGLEVEYTSMQHRFALAGGPFPAEDTVEVVHFGYADGAAYPEHAQLGNLCPYYVPQTDVVGPWDAFCDRTAWLQTDFVPCDTCFCWEATSQWISRFVAGVGGPYYWRAPNEFFGDYAVQRQLLYFRKGTEECGLDIVMGTDGGREAPVFAVMPNPATDELRWAGSGPGGWVLVMDASGRVLQRIDDSGRTDVSDLAPGSYLLALEGRYGARRLARFVKQ